MSEKMTPDELLKKLKNEVEQGSYTESATAEEYLADTIAMFRTLRDKAWLCDHDGEEGWEVIDADNLPTEETLKEYEK